MLPSASRVQRETALRSSVSAGLLASRVLTHSAISSTVGTASAAADSLASRRERSSESSESLPSVPGGTTPISTARRMFASRRPTSSSLALAERTSGESASDSMASTAALATLSENSRSANAAARALSTARSTSARGNLRSCPSPVGTE